MNATSRSIEIQRKKLAQPKMLRQQVVDTLRHAIARGELAPGDRLVERELVELTGVSRTSVREALRHLEAEGLVTTIPNKGPIVNFVSLREARDLYEVRRGLEGLAGWFFAERASDEQVKELRDAFDRSAIELNRGNIPGYFTECLQLREFLFVGCDNQMIYDGVQNLQTRISFLSTLTMSEPLRPASSLVEHHAIVTAIEKRDREAARKACESHVINAAEVAMQILSTQFATAPIVGKRASRALKIVSE